MFSLKSPKFFLEIELSTCLEIICLIQLSHQNPHAASLGSVQRRTIGMARFLLTAGTSRQAWSLTTDSATQLVREGGGPGGG